jgi:DNA-binding SARP family transcriptional activator
VEFRILGPLEVVADGRPLGLGRRKQRAVLAILLVHANRVVALDRLVAELWGEEPPPQAIASLQAYVSHLRRLLEPDRSARTPAADSRRFGSAAHRRTSPRWSAGNARRRSSRRSCWIRAPGW